MKVPNRTYDGSWDCQYWMAVNGIEDSKPFDDAWNDPKTELQLPIGAIVRKIDDPTHGRRIEWWYGKDSTLQPVVTVEEVK